jgi:hypothetical protein
MSASCCHHDDHAPARDDGFRRVLWIALIVNAGMFLVEGISGLLGDSVSLQADALDFLGDAANYGLGLAVLGLALTHRATAARPRAPGPVGPGRRLARAQYGRANCPQPAIMAPSDFAWLLTGVAALLYRHRTGDSNRRRSACTRNDAIGNLASCWLPPASLRAVLARPGCRLRHGERPVVFLPRDRAGSGRDQERFPPKSGRIGHSRPVRAGEVRLRAS